MSFKSIKHINFKRRALRVHKKCRSILRGRLRLSIFRSNRHVFVQLIDDCIGNTVYSVSTMAEPLRSEFAGRCNKSVVLALADYFIKNLPTELYNSAVVFDKGGYAYAGKVKVFADAVRACLKF